MKKILTLVLPAFIFLSIFACHKDQTAKPDQYVNADLYSTTVVSSPPGFVGYSTDDTSSTISARSATGYGPLFTLEMPKLTGTGVITMKSVWMSISSTDRWKGYGLNGTITEFGAVGGYISGTFSGNVRVNNAYFDTNPDLPITGSFHVKRTR